MGVTKRAGDCHAEHDIYSEPVGDLELVACI
jgi:hypothetical protein